MNRLILACQLAVFMSGVGLAWSGTLCPHLEHPLAAPAGETAEIIAGWFSDQGYAVRRDFPRPGTVHLSVWNSADEWDITVRPRSALASVVTVFHEGGGDAIPACRRLQEHLDGYLLGTARRQPPRAHGRRQAVPSAVLERIETVVCIRARSMGREVQFSGFIVDPEGLVLCTAHDLADHQQVTVTFFDSVSIPGTIARMDLSRDLALVACSPHARAFVAFSSDRNLPGTGDSVFSVGCLNSLKDTVSSGTINGPPMLVNDQPLWLVDLDIYPGSSGSPVFDSRGLLVGMVKGRYRGTSTLGFLTPLETIVAFLFDAND